MSMPNWFQTHPTAKRTRPSVIRSSHIEATRPPGRPHHLERSPLRQYDHVKALPVRESPRLHQNGAPAVKNRYMFCGSYPASFHHAISTIAPKALKATPMAATGGGPR